MRITHHKTSVYFVDDTKKGAAQIVPVASTDLEIVDPFAYKVLDPDEAEESGRAHAQRLAECWNACEGLELPMTLPAGALTTLVRQLGHLLHVYDINDAEDPFRERIATIPDMFRNTYRGKCQTIESAVNACHGLDLPLGVDAGLLKRAVDSLRRLHAHMPLMGSITDAEQAAWFEAKGILAELDKPASTDTPKA